MFRLILKLIVRLLYYFIQEIYDKLVSKITHPVIGLSFNMEVLISRNYGQRYKLLLLVMRISLVRIQKPHSKKKSFGLRALHDFQMIEDQELMFYIPWTVC